MMMMMKMRVRFISERFCGWVVKLDSFSVHLPISISLLIKVAHGTQQLLKAMFKFPRSLILIFGKTYTIILRGTEWWVG